MTSAYRHRAAVAAWAVRRGLGCSWREAIAIGLEAAKPIPRGHDPEVVIDERVLSLQQRGLVSDRLCVVGLVGRLVDYHLMSDRALARAIADSRVGVDRTRLVSLHADRGGSLSWEDVARLSLEPRRNTVWLDRSRYAEQVERVVVEAALPEQRSQIGMLMGWGGEL